MRWLTYALSKFIWQWFMLTILRRCWPVVSSWGCYRSWIPKYKKLRKSIALNNMCNFSNHTTMNLIYECIIIQWTFIEIITRCSTNKIYHSMIYVQSKILYSFIPNWSVLVWNISPCNIFVYNNNIIQSYIHWTFNIVYL